jgi:hypothetical protein
MFSGRRRAGGRPRVAFVGLLSALSALTLGGPAGAATNPGSGSSVVVTHLVLNSAGQGYLVFQVQVVAGDPLPSFGTWIGASSSPGTHDLAHGYWSVPTYTGSGKLGILCTGHDPFGQAVINCQSTTPGASLPVGRYDISVLVTRIGALTIHDGSVLYPSNVARFESFPILDPGSSLLSTAEVRQVVVDAQTQLADLPVTLQIHPGDIVNSMWVTLGSRNIWVINPWHQAVLHGLLCSTEYDVGTEAIVCTGPGGGPLPVGQTSIVLPLAEYGPPSERDAFGDVTLYRNNNTSGMNVDTFQYVSR